MEPEVSVVVSTRNRHVRLGELLDGLEQQTIPFTKFEVVVVDDCSSDETARMLQRRSRSSQLDLRMLQTDRQSGQAVGRQLGCQHARGEVIAFTDDDCIPSPGWLEAGMKAIAEAPDLFVQGRTAPRPDELAKASSPTHTIDVASLDPSFQTCNVFYPRAALEVVGGFDLERFGTPPVGEDADLGWRVIGAGWRPRFCEAALTHHAVHELSLPEAVRIARRLGRSAAALDAHPGFREGRLHHGVFLKRIHVWLTGAILAVLLPRRLWPVKPLLAFRYGQSILSRSRSHPAGPPSAPAFALIDLTEMLSVAWEGIRRGRLFL